MTSRRDGPIYNRKGGFCQHALDFTLPVFDSLLVLTRFGHVALIVALLAATGTHWVVLQSVAWTTMLADNLRTASLTEAMQRTFDGKHLCSLCKKIDAGKKTERKSEFPVQWKKLEFAHTATVLVFSAPTHFWLLNDRADFTDTLTHSPPVPPPRSLLG